MVDGPPTTNGPGGAAVAVGRHSAPFSPAADPDDWQRRALRALTTAPRASLRVALVAAVILAVLGTFVASRGTITYTSRTVMLIDDPYRLATAGSDGVLLNLSELRLKYAALIGTDAIAGFLRASAAGRAGQHLGLVPTRANRQHGFFCFLGDAGDPRARPSGVIVLDIAAGRITGITRFLEPTLVKSFLPTWEPEP